MKYLVTSRPTAVNLSNALAEMRKKVESLKDTKTDSDFRTDRERIVSTIGKHARFMLERDANDNRMLAGFGADEILGNKPAGTKVAIMTICNTGSLATSSYGTALGVVRQIQERDQLKKVVALETRPYNQGSRLTAFEIVEEKMPGGTLICDSMAAALMDKETVDAVLVGANRVCSNGDTANKVGSYALSLAAAAHNVPFYVASPFTTLDVNTATGDEIHIEERPAEELLQSSKAPKNIAVWNPAFDVTPAKYISGIITERRMLYPSIDGTFDVSGFVDLHSDRSSSPMNGVSLLLPNLQTPMNYTEQTAATLPTFLAENAPNVMDLLDATSAIDVECLDQSQGKLNHVFMVSNKASGKQVVVKQALPYVRYAAEESRPLTVERAYFSYMALVAFKSVCPEHVPAVHMFSKPNALTVMEYFAPPKITLRNGLIQGIRFPSMAKDVGRFCAKTMFSTSGFALSSRMLREDVEFWAKNREMFELTEKLVSVDPYTETASNRWTSPQLDNEKKAIEDDQELKLAVSKADHKFVSSVQTLIHSLHTGSVMCSPDEGPKTSVIEPDFAVMGPMAFDTGSFIANLLLSFVSQAGHANREEYSGWILDQVHAFWESFVQSFVELWDDENQHAGYLYGREVHASPKAVKRCQEEWIGEALNDTLLFAGVEMIRRIVGQDHAADLDVIKDPNVRAKCELCGLAIAKKFLKESDSIKSMKEALKVVLHLGSIEPPFS